MNSQSNTHLKLRQVGKLTGTRGPVAYATGLSAKINSICRIGSINGPLAQIVAYADDVATLMSLDGEMDAPPNTRIYTDDDFSTPDANQLLGKVIDGIARPWDGTVPDKPIATRKIMSSRTPAQNPMEKRRLQTQLDVGVRAINGLLPVARGQRLGIFAGSGVGKSTLLSMMAKNTNATRVVIGLIGERSREVREFVEDNLGPGLAKSIVVAVTAGQPPLMKIQGAHLACQLAEQFRDEGHSCLLIMDSLTRYAMACREVGLASGEMPANKGYPPSAFSRVNALVERAGAGRDNGQDGDITAFYTVLSEGDDMQDPVADNARAILDGHIVLSRSIADNGIYPPIDVGASVSRATSAIAHADHKKLMLTYRQLLGAYSQNEDLIKAGAYQRGQDPIIDAAINKIHLLRQYVQQGNDENISISLSIEQLKSVVQ